MSEDDIWYLVRENLDELHAVCFPGSDCPYEKLDIDEMLDGILISSRIKLLSLEDLNSDNYDNRFHLRVSTFCLPIESIAHSFIT